MEHQSSVHKDAHRITGNFGGYGTGKTTTSREQVYKHMLITPNANVLVGAQITAQYEQTLKRELENDIPEAFVREYSTQKSYMDLLNGARILYRPLDDEEKLKSLNLSMAVILEASGVDQSIFEQLKTRLRNTSATMPKFDEDGNPVYKYTAAGQPIPVIDKDWRKIIVESNPDVGWVKSAVLEVSSSITKHGTINDELYRDPKKLDPNISSHVASTNANEYLPDGFINELVKNKPDWWVQRYIYSSFSFAEGLVYPRGVQCIIPAFDIPKNWRRIVAHDYGLSDLAIFLFGAVDEENGVVHIYKEVVMHDENIETMSKIFHKQTDDIPPGMWITQPIIDPKSGPKRDYNKKSLLDYYAEYNIFFKPGTVSVDARVLRTKTYTDLKKVMIHDCCLNLCEEIKEYKYPERKIGEPYKDKPVDKNNHSVNCLEWILMELPADPRNLMHGIYNSRGQNILEPKKEITPWGTSFEQIIEDLPFGIDFRQIY